MIHIASISSSCPRSIYLFFSSPLSLETKVFPCNRFSFVFVFASPVFLFLSYLKFLGVNICLVHTSESVAVPQTRPSTVVAKAGQYPRVVPSVIPPKTDVEGIAPSCSIHLKLLVLLLFTTLLLTTTISLLGTRPPLPLPSRLACLRANRPGTRTLNSLLETLDTLAPTAPHISIPDFYITFLRIPTSISSHHHHHHHHPRK